MRCNGPGATGDCGCDDIPDGACDCAGNVVDECGVCNGPGAIYDCGCSEIPVGDCDCEGNVTDAVDCRMRMPMASAMTAIVSRRVCVQRSWRHGIVIGNVLDAGRLWWQPARPTRMRTDAMTLTIASVPSTTAACNGPGAIYDCGCTEQPAGDCDCDGNVVDALGVCGGDCPADADGNGICDDIEGSGCADETACNFDPYAEPVNTEPITDYCLVTEVVAEHTSGTLAGKTTYRVSLQTLYPTDFVTSVSGDSGDPTRIFTTTAFHQDVLGGATPENINPLLLPAFPDLAYDSWITIGLDGPADASAGESAVSTVASPNQNWTLAFDPGAGQPGGDIIMDDEVGGVWYILAGDANGFPDADGRVLLAQFTTDGELSGNMQVQVFPQGDNENFLVLDLPLGVGVGCPTGGGGDNCLYEDALGDCGGDCDADADADGICDDDDCVGTFDECGVCNGPGAIYDCGCSAIPAGDCDCDGNVADALGVCGGDCAADADADGICDDVDECIGVVDECGVCNGPGATGDCGCDDIPDGACDCAGNVVDECGVCNGPGAIYDCGCSAIPAGDCDCDGNVADALGVCGGDCAADADADGICDDVDECIGVVDECGVCNGPGATGDCGCDDIPDGACDCAGNVLDAIGVCGGDCTADADADGICDDVDECVGTLDAIGVCNGNCAADVDADGICDDIDECVGTLDECGVCNGPGATAECGCDPIPDGACDCAGNVLDAVGVCGGDCTADADADGICDDVDECIGVVDDCGVCNGPGAIYDCGCTEQPAGDCDCDGNVVDALGVCGGDCPADADGNGICDDIEGSGCADETACNFDPYAEPVNTEPITDYCLVTEVVAEHTSGTLAGKTTYRVSLETLYPTDFVTSVSGDSGNPTRIFTTTAFHQDALGGTTPESINPLLLPAFPDLAYDSWITIGLDGPADASAGESAVSTVASPNQNWTLAFDPGAGQPGGDIIMDDEVGGVWYILAGDANGFPDADGRVLLAQFTTDGELSGNMQVQVFPQGDNENFLVLDLPLGVGVGCPTGGGGDNCLYEDALGDCGGDCDADADADGICDDIDDCVGQLDECGVCNGPGAIYDCGCSAIPAGDCDCDGNVADALGVCGGDCAADADADGICDDVDECIGVVDECGVCNGPGATGDCGCDDIPDGACDCAGNVLDAVGVCGGDCDADADADGICDDVDPCVGQLDECGVCNGPGAIYDCGCEVQPAEDCDCEGNQLDAIGVCGGDCEADINGNGICDDIEEQACDDPEACNYDPNALPYIPPVVEEGYCLELQTVTEHTEGPLAGMTTYRLVFHTEYPTDFVTSVFGNSNDPLNITTTTSFYQDILGGSRPSRRIRSCSAPSRPWRMTAG